MVVLKGWAAYAFATVWGVVEFERIGLGLHVFGSVVRRHRKQYILNGCGCVMRFVRVRSSSVENLQVVRAIFFGIYIHQSHTTRNQAKDAYRFTKSLHVPKNPKTRTQRTQDHHPPKYNPHPTHNAHLGLLRARNNAPPKKHAPHRALQPPNRRDLSRRRPNPSRTPPRRAAHRARAGVHLDGDARRCAAGNAAAAGARHGRRVSAAGRE